MSLPLYTITPTMLYFMIIDYLEVFKFENFFIKNSRQNIYFIGFLRNIFKKY